MTQPTAIAHYNLLDRMGEGGIGEVYRARDTKVGRTVALKIVSPAIVAAPERLARLLEDAAAAATLSHPNIATLWDVGEADGHHYLAYEFTAGHRLREEAAGTPLNPRRALDLAIQIADGVAEAHAHGVIHGDLRPDTVVVTGKGSAKILDFGMAPWTRGGAARVRAAQSPDALPPEAVRIVAYMSPEEAIGGAVDGRSDVFALGTITYELVTGKNPFSGATASETIFNIIKGTPPPPSQLKSAVPPDLDATITKALSPDIAQRQQSAAAFAAELRTVAAILDVRSGDTIEPSADLQIDDTPDRNSAALLTAVLVLFAAVAVALWWFLR
jgi:eukaryotic-like serine/threonine-protein kinase